MILPKSINVTTAWKQINKHNFFSPICQSVCNVVFVLCTVKFNVAINFCSLFSFCWFDVRGCIECVRWAGALWWLIREREIKFISLFGDKGVMGEGACSACHQMATSGKWEQKIATPVTLDPSECHFSFFFCCFISRLTCQFHSWRFKLILGTQKHKQGKSEGFDSCDRPSNLTQNGFKSVNFSAPVTLKFDGWPQKTIGHLFYITSSFVHHF